MTMPTNASTTTSRRRPTVIAAAVTATALTAAIVTAAPAAALADTPSPRTYPTKAACESARQQAAAAGRTVDAACWRVPFLPFERPAGWSFRIY